MADGGNDKDRVLAELAPAEERPVAREGSLRFPRSAFSSRSPARGVGWYQHSVFSAASTVSHFAPLTPWIPAISVDVVVAKGARTRRAAAEPVITFDFETSDTAFPPPSA